jgi:uncharacterized membrane protein YccC
MPDADPRRATLHALRVAATTTAALVVVEWLHLEHGNQAVFTAYMVLATFNFTAFQRGLERLGGRVLGVGLGIVFVTVFRDIPVLSLLLQALVLVPTFYVYFAGRLAYAALNTGLYFAAMVLIGQANPDATMSQGLGLLAAIALGVFVAELGAWLTGLEQDLHIHTEGEPLWPLRRDWVNRCVMMAVTVVLTQIVTHWLRLPAETAVISVMILTGSADLRQMLAKGEMRVLGALFGSAWAFATFVLLSLSPHFVLLVVLLFTGIFIAAYVARVAGAYAYAGIQMGLVIPLLLVGPPKEFGDLTGGLQRLLGVAIAMVVSLLVAGLWPRVVPPAQSRCEKPG